MDKYKMKDLLIERLENNDREFEYDDELVTLRISDKTSKKGITVSLPTVIAKWETNKDAAVDELIYYVENGLLAMAQENDYTKNHFKILPVIRSTSFPTETEAGEKFFYDEHTAETRIFYALDMEKTYRLIDEELIVEKQWDKEEIRQQALENLISLPTALKEDIVADNHFYFLNTNDGYDASRILNAKLLNEMQEKFAGEMVVAVPHQDVLIIVDVRNKTGYDIIAQMTMSFFANGNVPITSLSFIYEDEKLEPVFILGKNKRHNN